MPHIRMYVCMYIYIYIYVYIYINHVSSISWNFNILSTRSLSCKHCYFWVVPAPSETPRTQSCRPRNCDRLTTHLPRAVKSMVYWGYNYNQLVNGLIQQVTCMGTSPCACSCLQTLILNLHDFHVFQGLSKPADV